MGHSASFGDGGLEAVRNLQNPMENQRKKKGKKTMNIPNHPKSGYIFSNMELQGCLGFSGCGFKRMDMDGFAWNSHPCYMDFPQNCMALEMEFNAGFNAD